MEGKFDGMYMNHPGNKHDERSEEKHRKRGSHKIEINIMQGIVETQKEVSKKENASPFNHICNLNCALTVECPSQKQNKLLDYKTIKTRGPG